MGDSFSKEVNIQLIVHDMSRNDLSAEITNRTGLYCDGAYLSRVINGHRNPPLIKEAICDILNIDKSLIKEKPNVTSTETTM